MADLNRISKIFIFTTKKVAFELGRKIINRVGKASSNFFKPGLRKGKTNEEGAFGGEFKSY